MEDDTAAYRTFSSAAVGAIVLASLSLLALLIDALVALAIVAILLSLVALRKIRVHEDLAGSTIALLALALACFVTTAVSARVLVRRHNLLETAERHAQTWFQTLATDRRAACLLTMKEIDRASEGADLETVFNNSPELAEAYKRFYSDSLLERIEASVKRQEMPSLVETRPFASEGAFSIVVEMIYVLPSGERFQVTLERFEDINRNGAGGPTAWRVHSVQALPKG